MSNPDASRQQAGVNSRYATGLLSIDFGTCNSSAGFFWDGALHWVKDPLTLQPSVPSSVFRDGDSFLVGQAAEAAELNDPASFARGFKRALDSSTSYPLGDRMYRPEDLVAVVLRFLRDEANRMADGFGAPAFTAARIAVPATYASNRRELMVGAARQTGFTTVELIEEPVAAARSYGKLLAEGEMLLVYDMGGGTFDATLLRRVGHDYHVVGQPAGGPQLGGLDFDHLIYENFVDTCTEPQQRARLTATDPNDREARYAQAGLTNFCRQQKHQLSVQSKAGGRTNEVDYTLTREEFNGMITPLVEESLGLCEQMLQVAGVEGSQLGRVLMVGGSCRIPYIQQSLTERFKRPLVLAGNPELAVAMGGLVELGPPAVGTGPGRSPRQPAQAPDPAQPGRPVSPFGNTPVPAGGEPLSPENAVLRCLSRPGDGDGFALSGLRSLVGRGGLTSNQDLDLSILESEPPYTTSRRHAELVWVGGSLQIRDVGSTNGTWVNGERLPNPVPRSPSPYRALATGDRIRMGSLEFEVTTNSEQLS